MAVTVLSGTSGALYYKPAGTTGTFGTAGVDTTDDEITVEPYLNLKVGDPVVFSVINSQTGGAGTGTLPAGLSAGTTYYVIAYTASSGVLKVSATAGGSAVDITNTGTAAAPNEFQLLGSTHPSVLTFRALLMAAVLQPFTSPTKTLLCLTAWWKTCCSASKLVAHSSCIPTSRALKPSAAPLLWMPC
jgi:hypothetical protein